jgi:hypothetical protein
MKPKIAWGLALAFGLALMARRASASEAVVQPSGANWEELDRLLAIAETESGMVGLHRFGRAVALRESGGNPYAVNDSIPEARAACRGWNKNRLTKYAASPYQDAASWCWGSGGWFGFLPSTALSPPDFNLLDPELVRTSPVHQVAFFAAFVRAIQRDYFPNLPPEHRNWLSVRRAMASLGTMHDWDESGSTSVRVRERLAKNLIATGTPPSFMFEAIGEGAPYPGSAELLAKLLESGGQP